MPPTPDSLREMATAYAKAWTSHDPEAVAAFYEEDGRITINDGEPTIGRSAIVDVAKAFYADFPDLVVLMDDVRCAGNRALFAWTLEGKHAGTGNFVRVRGWETWLMSDSTRIRVSTGHFDAKEYARQIAGGI